MYQSTLSAVRYARENGTDGLDPLTYFLTVWYLGEKQSRLAATEYEATKDSKGL